MDKPKIKGNFDSLLRQHQELMTGRWITDLANTSAFLFAEIPNLNWVGFYLLEGDLLCLGPFQGKPACTEIPLTKGVCGKAARERTTIIVPNVHEFSDHIACDTHSRSEVVVPLISNGDLLGVLDIDSPLLNRFTQDDADFFEMLATQLLQAGR